MKARTAVLLGISIVIACADETTGPEPAELAELCGQEGPVRILELDPDRPLAMVAEWGTVDERRVLRVDYRGEEDPTSPIFGVQPAVGYREVWSVGPCGEDPLLLHADDDDDNLVDYESVYPEGWPLLPLVCDEDTGQISTLDPTGVRPPNVVFETSNCHVRAVDDGILTLVPNDEQTSSLILQQWPEDPWTMKAEPIVLLDSVSASNHFPFDVAVTDEDFLVTTADGELVAISRLDGETTTIATNVSAFEYDPSGRWLVWQSDAGAEEGPISLLDRQTDTVTELIEEGSIYALDFVHGLGPSNILHVRIEESGVDRFYRLPTLESVDVPGRWFIQWAADETRVLVSDLSDWSIDGPLWLVDTVSGELTSLFEDNGGVVGRDDQSFRVLEGVQCCVQENSNRRDGLLWRVPYEGERELVAHRATYGYVLTTDGRVVTPVGVGEDWIGSLIVVEPNTLDEQLIDEKVLRFEPSALGEIDGDPLVLYAVEDPERQGVWLARLPQQE